MPLFKSLQLCTDTAGKGPEVSPASLQEPLAVSDTAEKGPAVSTASLQQSPMLLFRCRLMLQQRKVDPGVLPCRSTFPGPDPYVVCLLLLVDSLKMVADTLPARAAAS